MNLRTKKCLWIACLFLFLFLLSAASFWDVLSDSDQVLAFNDGNIEFALSPAYRFPDCLFRAWVERWQRATPEEIFTWYRDGVLEREIGYDGRVAELFPTAREFVIDVERWWKAYQGLGVAKRIQAPPVLAVSRRAFGFDHREAQLGPQYTEACGALRRELLGEVNIER